MTTNSSKVEDQESADAETVCAAIDALVSGNIAHAEALLLQVIQNTPSEYSNSYENEEGIAIKFWDQAEFIHYVTWMQKQGLAKKNIEWIGNAYPRAHYYLGFIGVKRKQLDQAIIFLDRGQRLEPTNPKFNLEKAQALVHLGRKDEALTLYDQVSELGPYISAHEIAVARRGRGFVLIEKGDLDGAEAAFHSSLELEPDNEVAHHEMVYIDHLRQGGTATYAESVSSLGPDHSKCAACGKGFQNGIVISLRGLPVSICDRCHRKLTKKWWQFWK